MSANTVSQFRPSLPVFIVLFTRYRQLKMGEQMPPQGAIDTSPGSQDDRFQRLQAGIELGFEKVMMRLHDIATHVDAMPNRITEVIPNQSVASAAFGSVSEKYKDCRGKYLADICRPQARTEWHMVQQHTTKSFKVAIRNIQRELQILKILYEQQKMRSRG